MGNFLNITELPLFRDTCTREPKCPGCGKGTEYMVITGSRGLGKSYIAEIERLKKLTGIINEDVIGCYLCNYHDRKICSRFYNSGCRNLEACKRLELSRGETNV